MFNCHRTKFKWRIGVFLRRQPNHDFTNVTAQTPGWYEFGDKVSDATTYLQNPFARRNQKWQKFVFYISIIITILFFPVFSFRSYLIKIFFNFRHLYYNWLIIFILTIINLC